MAKNRMTPEQDILTREFYSTVATDPKLFPDSPIDQRSLAGILLRLLNYTVIDGKFCSPERVSTRKYGEPVQVTCEWDEDTRRALEALNEGNSGSENKADSGKSAKDSEVREAVLREDV